MAHRLASTVEVSRLTTKYIKIERQTELRDSVALGRARFLRSILEFRRHVTLDLYSSSFAEFVFAVTDHFKDQLVNDASDAQSDAFLDLLKQTIDGIEAKNEPPWLAALDNETRAFIAQHRSEVVVAHLRGNLRNWDLVDLAKLPLMRAIGSLMHIGEGAIALAFRDWRTINHAGCSEGLTNALRGWSLRWNLDAEWCRDHALRVLRQWLLDDPLRWTFLEIDPDPPNVTPTRNSRLTDLWQFAAKDREFDAGWSQATLSGEVFQGDPDDFVFKHKKLPFRVQGYNPIVHDVTEWRRSVELDFRIYSYETELNRLRTIKATKNQEEDLQSSFTGVLNLFKNELSAHVKRAEAKVAVAETALGLLRVKEKRDLDKHFEWTVRYQIPKDTPHDYELGTEIADEAGVSEAAISKAVNETLRQIGLAIRPKTPKTDLASRISRQLNQ